MAKMTDAENNLEGENLDRAIKMFEDGGCAGVSCLKNCPIAGTCYRGDDSDGGGLDVSSDGVWPDKLVQYLEPLRQEVLARHEMEKALKGGQRG